MTLGIKVDQDFDSREGFGDLLFHLVHHVMRGGHGHVGRDIHVELREIARSAAPRAETVDAAELRRLLSYAGELDTPSRQLARYVERTARRYIPNFAVQIVYRLDRFGRGGDHTPMFLAGFPAVRITETHENYTRQHQNLRVENGIRYGDVVEGVEFPYLATMSGLNAAALAELAWAPAAPRNVTIRGAVQPSTTLRWDAVAAPDLAGYRVYWRLPT